MLQHIVEIPVCILLKFPQQAAVQRLLLQGRFEIDANGVMFALKVPHVGAGAEDQRSGQAEMGK